MDNAISRSDAIANLIKPLVDAGNIDSLPDRIKNQAQMLFGKNDLNAFSSLVGELEKIVPILCH